MPRIVYGVLDVHRSHRIEIPDPARAAAAGRPDACTGCHVEKTRTWAALETRRLWGPRFAPAAPGPASTGPLTALLAGDPIARAVAADAIGRAPLPAGHADEAAGARAIRRGLLLDAMAGDDYPAVRQLAWRALRRLGGAPKLFSGYEATASAAERGRSCAAIGAALPAGSVVAPDPQVVRRLRGQARRAAIAIGE